MIWSSGILSKRSNQQACMYTATTGPDFNWRGQLNEEESRAFYYFDAENYVAKRIE